MTNDLLPCPFNHKHELERYITGDGTMVSCCSCGIEMHVDQWNTRDNKPAEVDLDAAIQLVRSGFIVRENIVDLQFDKYAKALELIISLATGKGGGEPAAPTQIEAGELEAVNISTLQDDIDWIANGGDVQTRNISGEWKCGTRSFELQNVCRAARAHLENSKGGV